MGRVLIVGGGITGLAAAVELLDHEPVGNVDVGNVDVTVWEASERVGGKLQTDAFGGVDHVDVGADSFLLRVPHGSALAARVGLGDGDPLGTLVSPEPVHAAVWHDGLHPIPEGIMLGVPAAIRPLATTSLLSWRSKLRAAAEPLLPRRDDHDSIGRFVRGRFGNEVHERLVDALVGSIYATDTDRASLAAVPQLAALANGHRSVLVGARRARRAARTAATVSGPIFAAPTGGMERLALAAAEFVVAHGGTIRCHTALAALEPHPNGWLATAVDGTTVVADEVILACPAGAAVHPLAGVAADASARLAQVESADVIMVRLRVPASQWPARLHGRSGYLVPKPVQRWVTAASFGSQKWSHWQPANGDQIVRVSIGRDGLPVDDLSNEAAVDAAIADLGRHVGVAIAPTDTSVTRFVDAFPQYRPYHHDLVAAAEASLPPGIHLAGASYRGIGVPACIADGLRAAVAVRKSLSERREFLS